ncbi:hypothetical protein [Comamonas sp. 26]|uniref:hypothetical protein n=1 Tax=Comamonas sp. 26 TaxID=2035201 RepID=UPI001304777F|nr:hypothetical protein [Comamonas sp. 26]
MSEAMEGVFVKNATRISATAEIHASEAMGNAFTKSVTLASASADLKIARCWAILSSFV